MQNIVLKHKIVPIYAATESLSNEASSLIMQILHDVLRIRKHPDGRFEVVPATPQVEPEDDILFTDEAVIAYRSSLGLDTDYVSVVPSNDIIALAKTWKSLTNVAALLFSIHSRNIRLDNLERLDAPFAVVVNEQRLLRLKIGELTRTRRPKSMTGFCYKCGVNIIKDKLVEPDDDGACLRRSRNSGAKPERLKLAVPADVDALKPAQERLMNAIYENRLGRITSLPIVEICREVLTVIDNPSDDRVEDIFVIINDIIAENTDLKLAIKNGRSKGEVDGLSLKLQTLVAGLNYTPENNRLYMERDEPGTLGEPIRREFSSLYDCGLTIANGHVVRIRTEESEKKEDV